MSEAQPAIELIQADISRSRSPSTTPVLHDVQWRVDQGDFWIVGSPPGHGKTDLLCTAAALQRPIKGYHLIFGKDTREMDEQELVTAHKKVGMVFDSGRLFPNLTIEGNLTLPLAYHLDASDKSVADRVNQVLEATGLRHIRDRHPSQITRSLHQRVSLARALVLEPEVLFIDNPLAGTDPRQARWWLDFLNQLHAGHALLGKRPVTIAVSTDDFRPWMEVARCFAILREGKFEIIGSRDQVRTTRETAVHELLASAFDPV